MKTSKDIALDKLRSYCAYQDRCHKEVRSKLLKLEIYGDDLEEIMSKLIEEKFLDESRFAKSFVRGKFTNNHWGRKKIKLELQKREISDYCIRKGLEEILESDYLTKMNKLITQKLESLGGKWTFENKQSILRYMLQKGYEYELVMQTMDSKPNK